MAYTKNIVQSYEVGVFAPPATDATLIHAVTGLDYTGEPKPVVIEQLCLRVTGGGPESSVTVRLQSRTAGGAWTDVADVTRDIEGDYLPYTFDFTEGLAPCDYWRFVIDGLDALEPGGGLWRVDGAVRIRPALV